MINIERVARTLARAAVLCGLLGSAGCNGAISSKTAGGSSGGPPIPSVKGPGDWGAWMLSGGTVGVGMFPAKFTFDVNAAPSCANDYVAFNTSLAGAADATAAAQTGTFTGAPGNGQTVTISSPNGASIVLSASLGLNAGTDFQIGGTAVITATNLADAIVRNNAGLGVTASNAGGTSPTVTVTATATGGDGNLISLKSTLSNFTWTGAALTGGVGTANIIAFNQLYTSQAGVLPVGLCGSNGPSVYWSYFTGTGTAVTSVVLSGDGSKVAFVENVGGTATLRILKWMAGEGTAAGKPVAPTNTLAPGQDWSTCPAGSCMSTIAFGAGAIDTKSSPFYNYAADVLYAGDNNGNVHKFAGVFNGTPTEVTIGWPITVNPGATLTSPVFDSVSGNIFVGDNTGLLSYIRDVGSAVGTPCILPCLGTPSIHIGGAGGSIDDAPVVDGSTGFVIATNSTDGINFGTILQADTALASSVSFKIGGDGLGGVLGSPIYSGAFDNTYFTSAKPSIAGHMYVCGKARTNRDRPAVYQLNFDGNGLLTSEGLDWIGGAQGDLASASFEACSPVTEFFNSNTATDWIIFSIGNNTKPASPVPIGPCTGDQAGCVLTVDVTNALAPWPPAECSNAAPVPANAAGSTSGFIVDNTSASPQASSFYFTLGANSTPEELQGPGVPACNTTAGTGCAVKLTQSTLQ